MKKLFRNLGKASLDALLLLLGSIFLIFPTIVAVLGVFLSYVSICLSNVAKFFYLAIKSQKAIIHFLTSKIVFSNGKDYDAESLQ